MKKNTYDLISMVAIVVLVASTIAAQHSNRAAYAFGILAILSAAGLFAAYVKALPKTRPGAGEGGRCTEEKHELRAVAEEVEPEDEIAARQLEAVQNAWTLYMRQSVGTNLRHLRIGEHLAHHRHGQVDADRIDFLVRDNLAVIRGHRQTSDPASVIVNVVEKLCERSKEPRFEFVLSVDGTFTIRQIPTKRAASEEQVVPTGSMVPDQPDSLVN